jgi:hypothetical protein
MAGAAATVAVVAEAINAVRLRKSSGPLSCRKSGYFRFILACIQHQFGIT